MNCIENLIKAIEELRLMYSHNQIKNAEFTQKLNLLFKNCLIEYDQEIIDNYQNGWTDCLEHLKKMSITETKKK